MSSDPEDPIPQDDPVLYLVEQIQAGIRVEENFEKLFHLFRPRVRSFFSGKGFSAEECRDLTQDVFFRVFKRIDTFRRESRFERWLWEIMTNVYFNAIRSLKAEKRRALVLSLDSSNHGDEDASPGMTVAAEEPSPEEIMLLRERSGSLQAAFKGLPDQMRRCCLLRYEQGLKYQEIADVLKISIETVKAHLFQARKRLIAQLGGDRATEKKKGGGP